MAVSMTSAVASLVPRLRQLSLPSPTRECCRALLRGLVSFVFVILCITWPGATLLSLIYLLAAYAAAMAVKNFLAAFRRHSAITPWLYALGATALIGGSVTLAWTGEGPAIGLLLMGAAFAARARDAWLFVTGIISFVLGVLWLVIPGAEALTVNALIGVHALSSGALLIAFAPRLADAPLTTAELRRGRFA